MNSMRFLLILFLVSSTNVKSWACSCAATTMGVKKIISYELVLLGEIEAKEITKDLGYEENVQSSFPMEYFKYTVKVTQRIKGSFSQNELYIYSSTQGSACGVNYEIGNRYYLFLYTHKARLFTGLCAQNMQYEKAGNRYKKIVKNYLSPKKRKKWCNVKNKLEATGKFANQKAAGKWTFYHEDRSVESSGSFTEGVKEGTWNYYLNKHFSAEFIKEISNEATLESLDKEHILEKRVVYKNGEMVSSEYLLDKYLTNEE